MSPSDNGITVRLERVEGGPTRVDASHAAAPEEGPGILVWTAAPDGELAGMQPDLSAFTGQDVARLAGRGWLGCVHPDDQERVQGAWERSVRAAVRFEAEFRLRRHTGEFRQVWTRAEPRFDEHGQLLQWVGSSVDVGELRERELRLRAGQARLRSAHQLAGIGFWECDAVSGEVLWSEEMYRILDRDPQAGPGTLEAYQQAIHPDDRAGIELAYAEARERGEAYELEHRVVRADGTERVVHSRGRFLLDERGEVIGSVGTVQDVTEQRQMQQALQQRELALAEAQRIAHLGSWEWDLASDRMTWSAELCRIYGIEPTSTDGTLDQYLARVHPSDRDRVRDILENICTIGGSFELEERIIRPDGTERVLLSRGGATRDEQRQVVRVVGTCQDITPQRQAEKLLRQATAEADAANRAKSEFLSRMSHELRTPLNAILGFGQLLQTSVRGAEDDESVEQILGAGSHLLALIDEVLDLAKIEAGHVHMNVEPLRLAEVVGQSVDLVRPLARGRGVELHVDAGLGAFVAADRQRFKQVLLNLLSNAIKYNRDHGTVRVTSRAVGQQRVRLEVSDTGAGIAPELKARLFTPFDRIGAERTDIQGTGLGLAVAKGLIESMQGQIGVESTLGEGSTFWIELPCAPTPEAEAVPERAAAPPETGSVAVGRRRVLYIEDNVSNLRLVERILSRRAAVELIPAMQGRLGLELAQEHRPDLILLDVHLPDLSGEEVLFQLKSSAELRDVPVVVISADATQRQIERLIQLGAHAYLTKPLNVAEFLAAVDGVLKQD